MYLWKPIKKSLINIEISKTIIAKLIFLKKKLLSIATEIIGVKFGGWGINLDIDKIKIKKIGNKFVLFIFCFNIIKSLSYWTK